MDQRKYWIATFLKNELRKQHLSFLKAKRIEPEASLSWTFQFDLSMIRQLDATDPRDKIYGLHSLFSSMGVPLVAPNYNSTLETVYEEATLAWIAGTASLSVLRSMPDGRRNSGLATWVPDWQDHKTESQFPPGFVWRHSQIHNTDSTKLSPVPGQLHVSGTKIGLVVRNPPRTSTS